MDNLVVNAVFGLQDMLSGGLERINSLLGKTAQGVAGLSVRMGKLALAMAPLAIAAGALILALAGAAQKAIAFESAMADVGKVVNFETTEQFKGMSDAILDMSGNIPMAADGIAAIVASAAQSGIAKNDLLGFTEQAAKMGVAFDLTGDQAGKMMADWRAGMNLSLPRVYALADAVNHLSNKMNATAPALGEVIQRVGAVGVSCGLTEIQVAALGGAFLSAGASPDVAATALKKFTSTLVKGAAMSKTQASAFKELGFSSVQMAKDMQTNAQGTIFNVLESLAAKPKELQMSLLTEMFGEEAVGAIAPLLANMGNLTQAFDLVGDASKYAGSMQAEYDARSKTTANTLQLLKNKWDALCIIIGNAFLPAINAGAELLGKFTDGLRKMFASPAGQWFLRLAGALATGILAITAFAGAVWAAGAAMPFLSKGFTLVKTTLLGLGAPFWLIIGACTALYLAYENNFCGIADTLNGWWDTVSLVVDGVMAVFSTLTGGVGEIRGELAEKIEAAGLLGAVTFISKALYRFKIFFKAIWMEVQGHLYTVRDKISAIMERFGAIFTRIGNAIGPIIKKIFGGAEITSGLGGWHTAGAAIGKIFTFIMDIAVFCLENVVRGIEMFADFISMICSLFTGDFKAAGEAGMRILDNIGQMFSGMLDILPFGLGDIIRNIFNACLGWITSFCDDVRNFFHMLWHWVSAIFSGNTEVISYICSAAWNFIKNSVSAVFGGILNIFSIIWDAVKNIFSTVTGWISGICSTAWNFIKNGISTIFGGILNIFSGIWDGVKGLFSATTSGLGNLCSAAWEGVKNGVSTIFGGIAGVFSGIWDGVKSGFSTVTGWIGDTCSAAWDGVKGGVSALGSGISGGMSTVVTGVQDGWNAVTGFFGSINLFESGAKILDTLKQGILSMKDKLVDSVSGVFSSIREYLPFSDAKKGPFSDLTTSGSAILGTLGKGVMSSAGSFKESIAGVFEQATSLFGFGDGAGSGFFDRVAGALGLDGSGTGGLALSGAGAGMGGIGVGGAGGSGGAGFGGAPLPAFAGGLNPALPPPATTEGRGANVQKSRTIHIENLTVTLPEVKEGQGFANGLKQFLEQYDTE